MSGMRCLWESAGAGRVPAVRDPGRCRTNALILCQGMDSGPYFAFHVV